MTATLSPTGAWTGHAFAHEAFVYEHEDEVAQRCVPFVEEGLARGEPVIVVATERVRAVLGDALAGDVDRLAVLAPAETWWQGADGTLAAYDRDLRGLLATGSPWRLIGEPIWLGYKGGRVWSRREAVANDCYAAMPYYSLCLHDRSRLAPEIVADALRTHPLTWDGQQPVPSPAYEPTDAFLAAAEPPWTPRPSQAVTTRVATAREARADVRALAYYLGWESRLDDMLIAVNELVVNAVTAAGAASVGGWVEGGRLVWEVADDGGARLPVIAGYVPPAEAAESGRGLWLARGTADDMSVRSPGQGTVIRLYFDRT